MENSKRDLLKEIHSAYFDLFSEGDILEAQSIAGFMPLDENSTYSVKINHPDELPETEEVIEAITKLTGRDPKLVTILF